MAATGVAIGRYNDFSTSVALFRLPGTPTAPDCQDLERLGGTPKPNSSVKSLHVDTLLESRYSENK
jgi:hypothetical protein